MEISNNNITDKGAIVIGNNTVWAKLKVLSMRCNKVGDEGCTAIEKQ